MGGGHSSPSPISIWLLSHPRFLDIQARAWHLHGVCGAVCSPACACMPACPHAVSDGVSRLSQGAHRSTIADRAGVATWRGTTHGVLMYAARPCVWGCGTSKGCFTARMCHRYHLLACPQWCHADTGVLTMMQALPVMTLLGDTLAWPARWHWCSGMEFQDQHQEQCPCMDRRGSTSAALARPPHGLLPATLEQFCSLACILA